jgi:hypothetical protein
VRDGGSKATGRGRHKDREAVSPIDAVPLEPFLFWMIHSVMAIWMGAGHWGLTAGRILKARLVLLRD